MGWSIPAYPEPGQSKDPSIPPPAAVTAQINWYMQRDSLRVDMDKQDSARGDHIAN